MHDEHGPRRLRQGNDTPETLLRAIDALRKGVDDSARLARVSNKLDGLLNAPPAAAELTTQTVKFGQKTGTLKLILGGLGLFIAIAPLFFLHHSDDGAVPGADRDGSSGAPTSSSSAVAPQPRTDEVAAQVVEQQPVIAKVESAEPPAPQKRIAKHAAHTRERSSSVREAATENTPRPDNTAAVTHADAPATPKVAPASEPAESPKAPQPSAAKPKPPDDTPPVPAEADLLLKARKALKLDPSLTLSLVTEHQSYYPKGRLVPEREVLAIEALRNLGRKQEADERLKKFEARYPKSIHLQRLHESK